MRDAISRRMLVPALRLMRAEMQRISDPVRLRELAAQLDARLSTGHPDAQTEPVLAGDAPALWIDVKGARKEAVVLYLHGGAFVAETPTLHGALVARICREAHARGLMVSYRLAPEHRYPAALDDCMSAYRWLLDQGHDPRRILVAGDSAGGNLTLALLLRARDEGLPLPAGAVALSPVADFTFSGDSVQRNDGIDDMFSADMMEPLVPVYLPQPDLRTHPHVSPLFGDYAGLPPVLLIVGSTELLLDDAVRVAQRCPSAQLLVWHGMPHVFPAFDFLPQAREAIQRIGAFMRACVTGEVAQPAAEHIAVTAAETAAPPPSERVPTYVGPVAWLYLAMGVSSALVSLAVIVGWIAPSRVLADPVLWAAVATVVAFVLVEREWLGWRRVVVCLVTTLLLGPGCGLALFLFWRASGGARSTPKEARIHLPNSSAQPKRGSP